MLRNSIGPALSMTGLQVGLMFAGVLVVEQIFGWPGIGQYTAQSIPVADFPAIAGVTLLLGVGYVVINTVVDVLRRSRTRASPLDFPSAPEDPMTECPQPAEPSSPHFTADASAARTPGRWSSTGQPRARPGPASNSFMKLPVCLTPEDLPAGEIDVAIGGAPWDGTVTGRSGTHLGPMAIRSIDYIGGYGSSLPHLDVRVNPLEHLRVCDYGDAPVLVGNTLGTFDAVKDFIAGVLGAGVTPLILGGDHSITWPTATAVADAYGHGKVGIIHFDAHADTAPDSPGSLASHGTPMRKLIESGAVPGQELRPGRPARLLAGPPDPRLDGGEPAPHALHGRDPPGRLRRVLERRSTRRSTPPTTSTSRSTSTSATRRTRPAPARPSPAGSPAPTCCASSAGWRPRSASSAWTSSRSARRTTGNNGITALLAHRAMPRGDDRHGDAHARPHLRPTTSTRGPRAPAPPAPTGPPP